MIRTRSVFGTVLVVLLAATSARAQATAQARRACPSCDSTRVAEDRERSRLVATLIRHQTAIANLRLELTNLVENRSGDQERRNLEALITATQGMIADAERQLREACGDEDARHGSIGALFIADTLAQKARYPVVYFVTPGSPAARAGIAAADTVVQINGRDVRTAPMAAFFQPGRTLAVTLRRGDGQQTVRVAVAPQTRPFGGACGGFIEKRVLIGRAPSGAAIDSQVVRSFSQRGSGGDVVVPPYGVFVFSRNVAIAGADLEMLNDGLRAALQLAASDTGAFVVTADTGAPAGRSGLRSGDVIVRAAGRRVTEVGVVMRAVVEAPSRSVKLEVLRVPSARPGVDARGQRRERVTITLRW